MIIENNEPTKAIETNVPAAELGTASGLDSTVEPLCAAPNTNGQQCPAMALLRWLYRRLHFVDGGRDSLWSKLSLDDTSVKTLAKVLNLDVDSDLHPLRKRHRPYRSKATTARADYVDADVFWRELLAAFSANVTIIMGADLLRIFHVRQIKSLKSPVTELQLKLGAKDSAYQYPSGYRLSFRPRLAIEMLLKCMMLAGRYLFLDQGDLRAQMMVRNYWVAPPPGRPHQKRFGRGTRTLSACWEIDVDKHKLGYQPVTDEEFQKSLYRGGDVEAGIFLPKEDWSDPRKGDLFALIELLIKAMTKNEGDAS
ncbi:MAG: hypothetical protein WCS42_26320 [Verrucomicrobiota bacterium]